MTLKRSCRDRLTRIRIDLTKRLGRLLVTPLRAKIARRAFGTRRDRPGLHFAAVYWIWDQRSSTSAATASADAPVW